MGIIINWLIIGSWFRICQEKKINKKKYIGEPWIYGEKSNIRGVLRIKLNFINN